MCDKDTESVKNGLIKCVENLEKGVFTRKEIREDFLLQAKIHQKKLQERLLE